MHVRHPMQPCSRAMAVRGADAVSLSPFRIQRFLSCLSNMLCSIVSPATYHVALSALAHTLYAVRVASVRSLIEFYQCLLPPTCLPNSAIGNSRRRPACFTSKACAKPRAASPWPWSKRAVTESDARCAGDGDPRMCPRFLIGSSQVIHALR